MHFWGQNDSNLFDVKKNKFIFGTTNACHMQIFLKLIFFSFFSGSEFKTLCSIQSIFHAVILIFNSFLLLKDDTLKKHGSVFSNCILRSRKDTSLLNCDIRSLSKMTMTAAKHHHARFTKSGK